jgi:predicted porin
VRKTLISAIAITGLAASAHAADLGDLSLKDPLPDGPITWRGVTLYGTIDVGLQYSNHSAKADAFNGTGINEMMFGNTQGNKAAFAVGPNGLEQSKIGLKIEEKLGYGLTAIGQIEMGFLPTTGEINDGCKTLQDRNGVPTFNQLSSGDSSRCGQAFGGPVFAGLSSASYGTLTFGRQNTLQLDAFVKYDPQALSYPGSLAGYTGGVSGAGDTEDGRWDQSVKYTYQYGPVHVGGMYAFGSNGGSAIQSNAYGGDVGIDWRGFSIDAVYEKEHGAVSSAGFGFATTTTPTSGACYMSAGTEICPPGLSGTISDNSSVSVQGKYVMDFGGGYKDGGYKDSYAPGGKLTLFAGAERIVWDNPNTPVTALSQTVGGYTLFAVNNTNYATSQVRELQWAGARYEWGNWMTSVGYYHYGQNAWLRGTTADTCATQTEKNAASAKAGTFFGNTVGVNCSGDFNLGSWILDYKWSKHFDQYIVVNYSTADGGFANGYLSAGNEATVMTGIRLKF